MLQNKIDVTIHLAVYSDTVVTATLVMRMRRQASDITMADWVIDELALVTESGKNLTHLIFHPIQKSKNRKIEILYSLRIRAGV